MPRKPKKPTKAQLREYFAQLGRKGGPKSRANLSPQRRKQLARKAAEARWQRTKTIVAEITRGTKQLENELQAKETKRRRAREREPQRNLKLLRKK